MRFFYVIVISYFMGLIFFFFIGLGKITSLMFPAVTWNSIKDIVEVMAGVATASSALFAVYVYSESEKEKRYIRAWDIIGEIKSLCENLSDFYLKRYALNKLIARFYNSCRKLSLDERKELGDELAVLMNMLLQRIELSSIFGSPIVSNRLDDYNWCIEDDDIDEEILKIAFYLYVNNLVSNRGDLWGINDQYESQYFLPKIMCIAQPILIDNFYFPKSQYWRRDKLDSFPSTVPVKIARLIKIFHADNNFKNRLFSMVEKILRN